MKKKAFSLLLAAVMCLALLPVKASAIETLRLEGSDCIFTVDMWDVGDAIRLTNVSALTSGYYFDSLWEDCAVVYGQTTLTLLKSGLLYAERQNGKTLYGSNVVQEPSDKNIGATLTLTEPGFYHSYYSVGGDWVGFTIEVRPALPHAATPKAAYAAYLEGIINQYGILEQFADNNVPHTYVNYEFVHPTGLFYAALVDFDKNGTEELLVIYFEDTTADYFGVTCEVWSADGGVLKPLFSNKNDGGMPFAMASSGPIGSISLSKVDGKTYLHTLYIGYTGTTKVEGDVLYTLSDGQWRIERSLEWGVQTPDEGGEVHTYLENDVEITAAAYQTARAKIAAGDTLLASTVPEGITLHIEVPNYHTAVTSFVASLGNTKTAKPTASTVLVNGKHVEFEAFEIDGNNYFKLRDIAAALNGSEKQFSVQWDGVKNTISLTSGVSYTLVGGELTRSGAVGGDVTPGNTSLLLDGVPCQLAVYTISGNNYFKLRDLGQALQFSVRWDGATGTVQIDTISPYEPEA